MTENETKRIGESWPCIVPETKRGSVVIERFAVSEAASQLSGLRGDCVPTGTYTRLMVEGKLVMSDTPKEKNDHCALFRNAQGHVLLNGLGLGCCLNVVRNSKDVTHVTVIESNPDVIAVVAPHFPGVEIIHADALEWKPPKGVRYNAVWHDIWSDMCTDNLLEMHCLHRRYGRRCDWQGSWSREHLERERRRFR